MEPLASTVEGVVSIWDLLSEQTPLAIRWIFGGLFTALLILVGWLFKRQRNDIRRLHTRIDNLEGTLDRQRWSVQRDLINIQRTTQSDMVRLAVSCKPPKEGPDDANGTKGS